jgi:hypothetical protein
MGSLECVYPNYEDEEATAISDSLLLLKELFFSLTAVRNKCEITSDLFAKKMIQKPFFSEKFSKMTLVTTFEKFTGKQKKIIFVDFVQLMIQFHSTYGQNISFIQFVLHCH